MYDERVKEYARNLKKEEKKLNYRKKNEKKRNKGRDEYMRDYARILYSSSFRRLQGKMQLLGIDPTHFHRNRLTHSLEVAQIARTIAAELKINSTVCEAASLAHDIGNPPFGHYGEKVLNKLLEKNGGFEGNAQTFRILRKLEKKHHKYYGLNLTLRVLFSVVKYNQKRVVENNKEINNKFLYDEDWDFLKRELESKNIGHKKSISAQVMDLADEIAYAAHDLEDALSFRIINIDELLHEFYISDEFKYAYGVFNKIVKKCRKKALKAYKFKTSEEYFIVLKKELTSTIVHKLCTNISLNEEGNALDYKNEEEPIKLLVKGLKKLLFKAILRKKDVQLYEKRGEKIIKGLFEVYTNESFNKDLRLLPPELRALKNEFHEPKERIVADYISGMMDSYAIKEYITYFGEKEYNKYF